MSERMQPPDAGESQKRPPHSPQRPPDADEFARSGDTDALQPTRPLPSASQQMPPASRPVSRPPQVATPQAGRKARQRHERRQAVAAPPPASAPPPGTVWPGQAPSPARPRAAVTRPPSQSGLYFPWWSLLVLIGVVGVITLGLVFALSAMMEPNIPGDQPPRVQVITAQPTLSQDFLAAPAQESGANPALWPTPIRPAQPTATLPLPTPIPSPTLPPGDLAIGVLVRVVGVGASGLNIRSSPGYAGTPRFLAAEDEIFAVVDGPQTVDGLEWWRVEDPEDSQRFGWAARNYLTVITQSE